MSNCKCSCSYIAIIVGILFGFLFGVLGGVGIVPFLPLIAIAFRIGVLGLLLIPIYSLLFSRGDTCGCFCPYRRVLTVAAVGTILSAILAYVLFVSGVGIILVAIAFGLAAFFTAFLLGMLICITRAVYCLE